MERKTIKVEELKAWLDEKKDFLLVDVLPPEYFAERHIIGAVNAPVYEVVFLTYFEKLEVPKDKTIVVYNEQEKSLATADAATKLADSGYTDVYELPGGLSLWEKAGYPLEKGEALAAPALVDARYEIDPEKSIAGWTGRNPKYAHHGKITVKSGNFEIKDENIVSGGIVLDMTTIKDDDLTEITGKGILEAHLKSSDFFDVKRFPEASFHLESAEKISAALMGTPNYVIRGGLTIKGVTNPISFPAMIVPMEDGSINAQAHFDFDRTLWNVRYGSEKFFEKLGMHLVNDKVSLELFLVVKK